MTDALNAVRPGGTVSVVGVHDLQPFPLPALGCLIRSITLRMTTAPVQRTWPELIPLLQSGRLDVDGIFTTTLPLDEAAKGYATAESRSGDDVKILLTPLASLGFAADVLRQIAQGPHRPATARRQGTSPAIRAPLPPRPARSGVHRPRIADQ